MAELFRGLRQCQADRLQPPLTGHHAPVNSVLFVSNYNSGSIAGHRLSLTWVITKSQDSML